MKCFEETAANMVLKVFDPDCADKIFESESTGIDWLAGVFLVEYTNIILFRFNFSCFLASFDLSGMRS
jgi:hypothetical protein